MVKRLNPVRIEVVVAADQSIDLEIEMDCPYCERAIAGGSDDVHMHLQACGETSSQRMDKLLKRMRVLDWVLTIGIGGWCVPTLVVAIAKHNVQHNLITIFFNGTALFMVVMGKYFAWRSAIRRREEKQWFELRMAAARGALAEERKAKDK